MGELIKLEIIAFKDKTYKSKVGRFELPVNPESFSQSFTSAYDAKSGSGNSGTDPEFKFTKAEEVKFSFYFDGTGAIPLKSSPGGFQKQVKKVKGKEVNVTVKNQVDEFLKVAYVMNGESHKPNFLQLIWGNSTFGDRNSFYCVLTSLNITYTLFAPGGEPLRAKLDATFLEYIEQRRRVKEEGKSSPDITHVRSVKAGDSLPLMVYEIYGDQSYYLQVAKANGLVNFRQLNTRQSLKFPPINKTSL